MAATSMDQDRLKRAAEIRTSGRKSKGAVYHYSIAWSPEEAGKIDKAEMLKAVDQSLEALGAEDRQTMIVCHNDEDHPHAHVVTRKQIAADLGVGFSTLNKWVQQDRDKELMTGPHEDQEKEITRLRKENRILREEREILKKATVFFASQK